MTHAVLDIGDRRQLLLDLRRLAGQPVRLRFDRRNAAPGSRGRPRRSESEG